MTIGTRGFVKGIEQNVRFPKAEGYNIRVGNRWFRTIANKSVPLQLGTRDSLAPRQDRAGSIYENVLDIGYAWARTDLSGGEGLDWDPRELALERDQAALDTIRYWDSEGISVRRPDTEGDQYALTLARTFTDWNGTVATELKDIAVTGEYIFIADGDVVSWYSSWDSADFVLSDTLPSPIVALASAPNNTVVATLEDGDAYAMRNYPTETSFTIAYGDQGATKLKAQGVWYVAGRFILSTFDDIDVAELRSLDYVSGDWTDAAIDTANGPFWSVVESGPAVVAACDDGTIRTYTPDNGQGGTYALLPRGRTSVPEGEEPVLLGSNAGVLLIMTGADSGGIDRQTVRIYQAEVLDQRFDYIVGRLQLRRAWEATEHEGLVTRNMTNTRDEIFWFVKEQVNGLGPLRDTTLFVESLWRFDLVTSGLSRVATDVVPNIGDPTAQPIQAEQRNLNGLVVFEDIVGGIDFNGSGIRISDPDLHQGEGYVIFPNITFGLNTEISWIAIVMEAQNLVESGGQVELWRSTKPEAILDRNHPSWVLIQRLSSQASSNVEVPLQGLTSRTLALQLKVFATEGNTQTPRITRIGLRGIPAHRDFIMMVPFNVSDHLSVPGRKPIRIPGMGNEIHEEVMALVGKNVEAIVLDPFARFQGVVNNVSEPIDFLPNRGSVTKHVMVEFRGSRLPATATQPPTGDDGMGLGLMGVATIGVGQTGVI